MSREVHVWFCESARVRLPRATHLPNSYESVLGKEDGRSVLHCAPIRGNNASRFLHSYALRHKQRSVCLARIPVM